MMMKNKFETVELSLDSYEEKDGKFYFRAKSLTKDFECERVLETIAKRSKNKDLVWRHTHPIQEENKGTHIYGRVDDSISEDGRIITTYEPYNHTQDHKDFIELIKEKDLVNDPIGISLRYRKYFKNDKINHVDVFEHSLTPYPKCEECRTIDYIGEKKMPEDEKKKPNTQDEKETELEEDEIKKHLEKIAELEKNLNSRTETLEGYKTKIETLEKDIEEAKDSNKKETMTLEDRVKQLEESLEKQDKEHKEAIETLEKKPVLDEIFELIKVDDRLKEFYASQDKKYLETILEEERKKANTPIPTQMGDTADKALEKGQDVDEDKDKKKDELNEEEVVKFTQMLDGRIRDLMLEHIKGNKKESE